MFLGSHWIQIPVQSSIPKTILIAMSLWTLVCNELVFRILSLQNVNFLKPFRSFKLVSFPDCGDLTV